MQTDTILLDKTTAVSCFQTCRDICIINSE